VLPAEPPEAYIARIVRAKLEAVRVQAPRELVSRATGIVVADTTVVIVEDGVTHVLGKPADTEEACRMILRLAGRTHEVFTRFAVASVKAGGFMHEETVRTEVTFRPLSPERAMAYARSGEGLDKAGAYGAQEFGSAFIKRVSGSYTNVVGLPACEVAEALEALALEP
jgi:septum formation protein